MCVSPRLLAMCCGRELTSCGWCLTAVFWNACIAHCLYRKIVRGDSEALLHRRLKFYVIGSAAAPAIVSSLLLGGASTPYLPRIPPPTRPD